MKYQCCMLMVVIFLPLAVCLGQNREKTKDQELENLRKELLQLRRDLENIKTKLPGSESYQEDQVNFLEEQMDRRLRELESKIDAVSRASAPTVLNPRTTAFINFAARTDNKTVYDLAHPSKEISNRPFLRTFEIEFRNPVDPYAEAVAVISVENEAANEFAIDAEEVYGLIKRLPLLERAPLGMKLKIGKFRAPLGVNNKIHMHDLPWTIRPLVISKYLGTEHGEFFESGFNPTGIDLDFFLPNPVPSTTLEMNVDVVRSGDMALSQNRTGKQPAFLGHLTLSKDWNNEHLLILGGSAYDEHGDNSTRLWSADITYKWAPAERRGWHSFVTGGELFSGKHSYLDSTLSRIEHRAYGWFGYAQYQFSYWTYVGIRYDWLQEPSNDQLVTKSWSAYVSYYTTEFLRFRIGYQHLASDVLAADVNNVNSVLFDINFVFGSHPTEPYWVSR